MFKTAIHEPDNPERTPRTPCPSSYRRFRVSFKKTSQREEDLKSHSNPRPFTSPLQTPRMNQTFNTTGKSANYVNLQTVEAVRGEFQGQFKGEMNGYLESKLKNMIGKRQEDIVHSRYLSNTIDFGDLTNPSNLQAGPLDNFYSTIRQSKRLKIQKGVEGAYVCNTKQHIRRLIQRKRQQQYDYKQLNKGIKVKREKDSERRAKSLVNQFNVPQVDGQIWDKEWRADLISEKKRYRKRLSEKYNKQTISFYSTNFNPE